jgi:uncharacterized membrane-anchored protein
MACTFGFSVLIFDGLRWGWTGWDLAFRILVGIVGGYALYLRYKGAYFQARKVKRSPKVTRIELIVAILLWTLIGAAFLLAFLGKHALVRY